MCFETLAVQPKCGKDVEELFLLLASEVATVSATLGKVIRVKYPALIPASRAVQSGLSAREFTPLVSKLRRGLPLILLFLSTFRR
jgi:hypothetical protein